MSSTKSSLPIFQDNPGLPVNPGLPEKKNPRLPLCLRLFKNLRLPPVQFFQKNPGLPVNSCLPERNSGLPLSVFQRNLVLPSNPDLPINPHLPEKSKSSS